jgi:RNA polymerase sigma factor (sigma-70 family)
VLDAMRSLPRRQQEVLLLRYWSDLSESEIASTLGVAVGTVKSAASRGLDRLEKLLGEVR